MLNPVVSWAWHWDLTPLWHFSQTTACVGQNGSWHLSFMLCIDPAGSLLLNNMCHIPGLKDITSLYGDLCDIILAKPQSIYLMYSKGNHGDIGFAARKGLLWKAAKGGDRRARLKSSSLKGERKISYNHRGCDSVHIDDNVWGNLWIGIGNLGGKVEHVHWANIYVTYIQCSLWGSDLISERVKIQPTMSLFILGQGEGHAPRAGINWMGSWAHYLR